MFYLTRWLWLIYDVTGVIALSFSSTDDLNCSSLVRWLCKHLVSDNWYSSICQRPMCDFKCKTMAWVCFLSKMLDFIKINKMLFLDRTTASEERLTFWKKHSGMCTSVTSTSCTSNYVFGQLESRTENREKCLFTGKTFLYKKIYWRKNKKSISGKFCFILFIYFENFVQKTRKMKSSATTIFPPLSIHGKACNK